MLNSEAHTIKHRHRHNNISSRELFTEYKTYKLTLKQLISCTT